MLLKWMLIMLVWILGLVITSFFRNWSNQTFAKGCCSTIFAGQLGIDAFLFPFLILVQFRLNTFYTQCLSRYITRLFKHLEGPYLLLLLNWRYVPCASYLIYPKRRFQFCQTKNIFDASWKYPEPYDRGSIKWVLPYREAHACTQRDLKLHVMYEAHKSVLIIAKRNNSPNCVQPYLRPRLVVCHEIALHFCTTLGI